MTANSSNLLGTTSARFTTNVGNGGMLIDLNGHSTTVGNSLVRTGSGGLTVNSTGGGTLILSGSNNYAGVTALDGGVVQLANSAALGAGNIFFGGGTLQFSASNSQDYAAQIKHSAGVISLDTNNQYVNFKGESTVATPAAWRNWAAAHSCLAARTATLAVLRSPTAR